jgi:hypothetical protein
MKLYYDYLQSLGAKEIKRACFLYEKGATEMIDYVGLETTRKNLILPWMLTERYQRQSFESIG